jgi:membrane-bound serine protease (ClpP class)
MADKKLIKVSFILISFLFITFMLTPFTWSNKRNALVIELDGPVSSGAATFLTRGIKSAEDRGSAMVILRMDTPGGLGVAMKTMAKTILNSPVPVIVYIAPRGASAASAGVIITISANIAAMAPGTNIGAAHPVQSDGSDINKTMETKVVNDMASYGRSIAEMKGRNARWVEQAIRDSVSITAEEAAEKNVIDLVAPSMDELLKQIDGREVETKSGKIILDTKDLDMEYFTPRKIDIFLMLISDPTIMAILFSIGLLGLGFEITHPGAIFPGVIGAVSLILAFYSMQTLPVSYAGLLLILLAVVLFIAEIKITSYGFLSLGGIICLILGSMMFFEELGLNLIMAAPFIIVVGGFFILIAILAYRSQVTRPRGGSDSMIDEIGIVKQTIDKEGLVFVHGEYWRAVCDEKIDEKESVKVIGMEGLVLKVQKI